MSLKGGIIAAGKHCAWLTAIGLGCTQLDGQDISSSVLAGIQVAAVLRQQELRDPAKFRTTDRLVPGEPFTPAQRWARYVRRTYSAHRLGLLAAETAMDHALGEPACWDGGAGSYARRYTRAVERRMIRNTAEFAAGLLTGEDLRYPSSRSELLSGRFWNAVRRAFVARMPDGAERPAYARFAATAIAEASTAHWTGNPVQPGWMAEALAWGALDQVQTNLLDEFGPDLRRISSRMWKRVRRLSSHARPEMLGH